MSKFLDSSYFYLFIIGIFLIGIAVYIDFFGSRLKDIDSRLDSIQDCGCN